MKSLKLLLRFAVLGGLVLLLLIPLLLIRGVIADRQHYRDEAIERVARNTAGPQRFLGPVRYLPYKGRWPSESGVIVQAPRSLSILGALVPTERRVGLFRVPVYTWSMRVRAQFDPLPYEAVPGRVYEQPYLAVGVSDIRGLAGTPRLSVAGRPLQLASGSRALAPLMPGLSADLDAPPAETAGTLGALQDVAMDITVTGTRSLSVVPMGDSTQVALRSSWPHPSFAGAYPPNERTIDAGGFTASWSLSALVTQAQTQLAAGKMPDAFSVELVDPIDAYTQADRASKYGLLFVLLTFTGFVLLELIRKLKIHPVQYLLVGLALAIFFLLLFSLSEHIAFWQAYVASALACIGLQSFYLAGVMRSRALAAGFALMLTALYGVLYTLLVSEDNALLMGSLLLFGILAGIMWLTRRLDWYALNEELR
ncbi:cell envelope integrity protein CreD [Stenotrophomonas sp. HITSZ_GD]|uniref:cell envelope integrity protein CreD n=1 Tax=Stenotrophomonas sp. HITSZ_GD TaxID=3037248 RepID=UPI00240E902D|nr:cell envelope integrity protein CreD [Stenotrophomonas sp. HITSZ_GD]MDG2525603.1 cell envelope integrity protein CreD [Stenotrophomonas sp. HITSZ_GD]